MGLPVIGRENPDFFALKLLCTILGGYFGSRLMSNIREEKGYTYGISSSQVVLYGDELVGRDGLVSESIYFDEDFVDERAGEFGSGLGRYG